MKRVRINTNQIGLVFKRGDYKRMITKGVHQLSFGEQLKVYDATSAFTPGIDLNVFLQDEDFCKNIHLVEVKDSEIAVKFENGNFAGILTPGRYVYFKGLTEFGFTILDTNEIEVPESLDKSLLKKVTLAQYIKVVYVESYEKAALVVDGKKIKNLEAGAHYYFKNLQDMKVVSVDTRNQQIEVSGQELLSRDKAAIRVNFDAQYKVVDMDKALFENKDYQKQLYIMLQLALREFVGRYTLDELLTDKESISKSIFESIRAKGESLGVKLLDSGIRDIILPGDVKEIMNQVLIAEKRAQANIITRREETASTRSLLNTAKLMEDNEMLFKLKEMEYVEKIADKINSISLSGGNQVVDQLRDIFSPVK